MLRFRSHQLADAFLHTHTLSQGWIHKEWIVATHSNMNRASLATTICRQLWFTKDNAQIILRCKYSHREISLFLLRPIENICGKVKCCLCTNNTKAELWQWEKEKQLFQVLPARCRQRIYSKCDGEKPYLGFNIAVCQDADNFTVTACSY